MELNEIFNNKNEKPLDNIPSDGGYTAIFRTIACIGDSLSSGEFEAAAADGGSSWHDMFEYSWGQFMARMCGSRVYNMSRGGMTAKEYCESFAEANGYWNNAYASQCYIIALGVNDLKWRGIELGSLDDIDDSNPMNNKPTFTGYYAQIIARLKVIQPRAKFFLMTMPDDGENETHREIKLNHRDLMYKFAEKYDNTYVLDLYEYAPKYNAEFREKFFMRGHMNPAGYLFTAKITAAYIDYIIRHNMKDFKEIGFIGTNLHS